MKTIIGKCKYFTLLFCFNNALFFEIVLLIIDIQYIRNTWVICVSVGDHYFFRQNTLFSGNNKEIDAVFNCFHLVMKDVGIEYVVGLKMVNHCAFHVIHFDVGFPFKVF